MRTRYDRTFNRHRTRRTPLECMRLEERSMLSTFTVSNTADNGDGSLRNAIVDANTAAGADAIAFDIPGAGIQTISPTSALPEITDPVVIDGYTQPGASPNTLAVGNDAVLKIVLDGSHVISGSGLRFLTGSSTVRGLVISEWAQDGISVLGSGTVIQGNFVGTDATGTVAVGNNSNGVSVIGDDNLIGGTSPAARNVISGNNFGVFLSGTGAVVQGNYIGTNASGTGGLGNKAGGIEAFGSNHVIGGTSVGARNVISANAHEGMRLDGVSGALIQGNLLGTDAAGAGPLGNGAAGVALFPLTSGPARDNTIGGTAAGAGNVIAFNGTSLFNGSGVYIVGADSTGNAILGNSVYSNTSTVSAGGLGIELLSGLNQGERGVSPNDPDDADTGANNLQNFPVITLVNSAGGSTVIQGTLNSTPSTAFRLEFFANSVLDPSGFGEGKTFLGFVMETTGAEGNATFSADLAALPAGHPFVTATATDPGGNTSEFSRVFDASGDSGPSKSATQTQWAPSQYTSRFGEEVILAVLVSSQGEGTPSGTVTFKIDGITQPPVAVEPYVEGRSVARFVTSTLSIGSHELTATYGGDDQFDSSDSFATFQVFDLDETTTVLTTSLNPSTFGQLVTFTVGVGPSDGERQPSGTVTFTIDGVAQSAVALESLPDYQVGATFATAGLSVGAHQVTATYSGDGRLKPSSSSVVVQIVNAVDPPPSIGNGPVVMSLARYGYHMMPTKLVLTFDGALDPSTAQNVKNYRLVGPGGRSIAIRAAIYDAAARTVTLRPAARLSLQRRYALTINGTSSTGVRGSSGQLLDGARTGRPGSDHRTTVLRRHLVIAQPIPNSFLAWLRPRRR
jgi:hypothetical protein